MSAFPQNRNRLRGSSDPEWDDASLWSLAERLANDDVGACDAMLEALGGPRPVLSWSPSGKTLPEALLSFLMEWWDAARGDAFAPPVEAVDPHFLRPALGHLSLLDIVDDGADFRYRIHGSLTAARSQWEWTGRLVSTIDTPMRFFFLVNYRAVLRRPEPLFATHSPPVHVRMTAWHRLILPLRHGAAVNRLLVAILPTERQDEPPGGGSGRLR